MSVFYNGKLWISPATVSSINDDAMDGQGLTVGNILCILGRSTGGTPFTPMRFGSIPQAISALIDGESLKAIKEAFDPSSQTDCPQEIVFIRVNPATQSDLTIQDVSQNDVIALESTDYGLYTNGIRIKQTAGSLFGKMVSTGFGNSYFSQDNILRNCFSCLYTGSNDTATIDIGVQTVTLTSDTVTSIDLNLLDSVSQLVDKINNTPDWIAYVLDDNYEAPVLNGLDGAVSQSCKNTAYVATGTLQAIIDWINSASEGFITATRPAGALNVPANFNWTYLTGGSDGEVTNNQWQLAFDALQTVDVQWVVPITSSPSIHAMTDTHCHYMSVVARMERRSFVGGTVSMSDAQAIAAAKALNSDRTAYVHLGFYDYNSAGRLTLYPPYILAALIGGMFSGVNPGTALTNKTIKVRGLERDLRNPTDTDQLLLGGVLCPENTKKGYKIVQSISTWLVNQKYNHREVSVGAACDFVSRNVRNALDDLRGQKATPTILTHAISLTETCLNELARPEPMGPAVIVGDKTNPAWKDITASIESDTLRVQFQCSPCISLNYILITIFVVPWHGTASLSANGQPIITS